MRCSVACLVIAFALGGCIPIKQPGIAGVEEHDHFAYYGDGDGYGLLQVGFWRVPKTVAVVDAESYAIGPKRERFGVASEPHPLSAPDNPHGAAYVRDRIYLVRPNGRRVGNWGDGDWSFRFVLDTPSGRQTRHFNFTLETFYYNPFIHGPPN